MHLAQDILGALALILSTLPLLHFFLGDAIGPASLTECIGGQQSKCRNNQNCPARGPDHAAAERRPLPAQLRIGHVVANPRAVENGFVNAVAHLQVPPSQTDNAGESQDTHQRIGLVVRYAPVGMHVGVEVQQASQVGFTAQQSLAHE